MMERLERNDKRLLALLLVVVLASVVYTRFNFTAAFPEASIHLRYSKDQIQGMAQDFLKQQRLATDGYRSLTLFDPDDDGRIYLERELGLEQANRLMQGEVSVWRWRNRWFRPPQKEEMTVWLSPDGRLVGYQHAIREDAPGARLSKDAARAMAAEFLKQRTGTPQRVVEEQLQARPNRYDYLFTWEQEGFRAKDATYRRTVTIQGDQVGGYNEFLHVPEQWTRDFASMRSKNELFSQIATVLYVPLILAAVGVLIVSFRKRSVLWRPLLLIAGAVGVLMIVNQTNALPMTMDRMQTSSPYLEMLTIGLLQALGAGVGVFFYVILAAAAGEPLYRRANPARLALLKAFTGAGTRTKEFFLATTTGYAFAAVHLAFVVAFYLIGRKFGVWSPQDVQYSDLLSTTLPWIYPIAIALLAATSEEFWFRLFAIPLLERWLKVRWIAVIIPAFVWGFLHANYPQQPGYIRGIEVGVIGVAAGFLMLRYGIVATLVWHFTVDAVMMGMFLFQSDNWYFQLSGWVVAAAVASPLAISLVHYWRRGGFESAEGVTNQALAAREPEAAVVEESVPAIEPHRAAWPVKWLYVAGTAGALALMVFHPTQFGDFLRITLTRTEARAIADREMNERHLAPEAWRAVTEFLPNLQTADFEYLREVAGARSANEAVRTRTTTGAWRVRYFQPLKKEEWHVLVGQEKRVLRVEHVLDEKAPGANLTAEDARRVAAEYVEKAQGVRVAEYRAVDASLEKRDARTDHEFVWEDATFRMGEAKARVVAEVLGDHVGRFRRYLKLPEQWVREFERPRLQRFLAPGLIGAVSLPLLVIFILRLSGRWSQFDGGHRYRWKVYLSVAAASTVCVAASYLNQWPLLESGYDTATPLDNSLAQAWLGRVMGVLMLALAGFLGALAVDVFVQMAAGRRPLSRPSLWRAVALALAAAGLSRALGVLEQALPGPRMSLPLWSVAGADTVLPAVTVVAQSYLAALLAVCVVSIGVAAAVRFLGLRMQVAGAVVLALVLAAGRALTAPQFALHVLMALVWVGVLVALIKTCAVDLVTFAVAMLWLEAVPRAWMLMAQPSAVHRSNGVAAVAVVMVAGGLLLYRRRGVAEAANGVGD
jgi:membrane protease YdiL (CAAX protease family)